MGTKGPMGPNGPDPNGPEWARPKWARMGPTQMGPMGPTGPYRARIHIEKYVKIYGPIWGPLGPMGPIGGSMGPIGGSTIGAQIWIRMGTKNEFWCHDLEFNFLYKTKKMRDVILNRMT